MIKNTVSKRKLVTPWWIEYTGYCVIFLLAVYFVLGIVGRPISIHIPLGGFALFAFLVCVYVTVELLKEEV